MKQELLECLVRECVKEVLTQVEEQGFEPTQGAPAPPADGTGAGEDLAVPKPSPTPPTEPSEPETPPTGATKGILLIDPKDKAKLQKIDLPPNLSDSVLERELYNVAARQAGPKVKVALDTFRAVKDASRNLTTTLYLYFGKYDPESEEIFLMADRSLDVAKDSTVPASELRGSPVSDLPPEKGDLSTAGAEDYARQNMSGGKSPTYGGVDERIVKAIKKMVNEILEKR